MPRRSRIDATGALHHVIARGITRQKIFIDDTDRNRFLDRLGAILLETEARCYAWALIPNHFHLLLRTGSVPLSTVMRRLLTSYAVFFNRRHTRWGHLFQNRYRSILCQKENYLLELVRYIHLNPLRAGLVSGLEALDHYQFAGHSVLLGLHGNDWQDTGAVLQRFGRRLFDARRRYHRFIEQGVALGKRPELTGGGLVRSSGGWTALKKMRETGVAVKGDERILGDSDFVRQTLKHANEQLERRYKVRSQGFDIDRLAERVADLMGIPAQQVLAVGKKRQTVRARSLLCYWAVHECGITMTSLAKRLEISVTTVSKSVTRGKEIAAQEKYELL